MLAMAGISLGNNKFICLFSVTATGQQDIFGAQLPAAGGGDAAGTGYAASGPPGGLGT